MKFSEDILQRMKPCDFSVPPDFPVAWIGGIFCYTFWASRGRILMVLLTFHLGLAAGQRFHTSDTKKYRVVKHFITFQNYKRGTDIHGSQVVGYCCFLTRPSPSRRIRYPLGSVCRAKPSCHKASLSCAEHEMALWLNLARYVIFGFTRDAGSGPLR